MSGADVVVTHDPDHHRFVIFAEGAEAGATLYERDGDVWSFLHTEVDDSFAGEGLATTLIGHALDEVRAAGGAVLPFCPFVRRFIARHAAYADLVPGDRRHEFQLAG